MRQWILFFVILTIGGLGIGWWIKDSLKGKETRPELVLHVKDTSKVATIKILDREGDRIHLYKQNKTWYLNDHIPARRHAVTNLLKTLHDQRVSALIPSAAKENVVKDLAGNSVRIALEDKNGKDIMTFYVGGVTPDERGTFMLKEGSEWPVIVGIPGFEGSLRNRYIMSELEWQSRKLVPHLKNFREIQLDYPTEQEYSLVIRKEGADYSIASMYEPDKKLTMNRYVGEAYQDLMTELEAEAVLDPIRITNLKNSMPFCQILITDHEDEVTELRFYPTVWIDEPQVDRRSFVERYYTIVNGNQLFLTQHALMEKVFLSFDHFASVSEELQ